MSSVLSYFVTPSRDVNFWFLSQVYGALSLVSVGFFVAQFQFHATSVTGWWMVTAPCIPALFYSLFLHSRCVDATPPARGAQIEGAAYDDKLNNAVQESKKDK